RLYDAAGIAQGNQFLVNTFTSSGQDFPAVGMDSTGAFTVAVQSNGQDGDQKGVYAQDFDPSGTKIGAEYRVSSTKSGSQQQPGVAVGYYDDLAIVWMGPGAG